MPKLRFVEPKTARLDLGDGEWIEVKERLTYGEQQQLTASSFGRVPLNAMGGTNIEVPISWDVFNLKRICTWVVDWSATDSKGRRLPVSMSTVGNMDPESVAAIEEALTKHIEAMEAAKNPTTPGE